MEKTTFKVNYKDKEQGVETMKNYLNKPIVSYDEEIKKIAKKLGRKNNENI